MNNVQNLHATVTETIMVVDDHELVLRGIRQILEQSFPDACIITADTGEKAVRELAYRKVGLVTVDLELPDMSGFNLIDHIRAEHPDVRILVNTVHDEIWTVKRLAERRVEGIVFKSASAMNFVDAVRRILCGENYYDSGARFISHHIESLMVADNRHIAVARAWPSPPTACDFAQPSSPSVPLKVMS